MRECTREIILCPNCSGRGEIVRQERVHWDEVEVVREQCPECLGTGRKVRVTEVWEEPFEEAGK